MKDNNTPKGENLVLTEANLLKHIFSEFTAWRFWRRVDKSKQDGCWPWRAGATAQGYGQFCISSKPFLCHRLAWMFEHQCAVPDGKRVILKCENRRCCNPSHLRLGTHKDHAKTGSIKKGAFTFVNVQNPEAV